MCGHTVCYLLNNSLTLSGTRHLIGVRLRQRLRHHRYSKLCIYRCSGRLVRTLHEKAPFVIGHKTNAVYRILERRTVSKNRCMSKFLSNVPISEYLKNIINQFYLNARCPSAQGSIASSGVNFFKMNKGLRQIPEIGGPVSAVG